VTLTEAGETRARHGNVLGLDHVAAWHEAPPGTHAVAGPPTRYRVLSADGSLLAIAEATPGGLQPRVVIDG
jgi:hypothetical protein